MVPGSDVISVGPLQVRRRPVIQLPGLQGKRQVVGGGFQTVVLEDQLMNPKRSRGLAGTRPEWRTDQAIVDTACLP